MKPLRAIFLAVGMLVAGSFATAQDTGSTTEPEQQIETPAVLDTSPNVALGQTGIDVEAWTSVAIAAEEALQNPNSTDFALERLRNELATWRDALLDAQSVNSARISTVSAQLSALGAAPEEGAEEAAAIANRRAELNAQLDELQAPVVLAQESYARANGLISEIDSTLRASEARRLGTRGESPWVLANWGTAFAAVASTLSSAWAETSARVAADAVNGDWMATYPAASLLFALALALLVYGRRMVMRVQATISSRDTIGRGFWLFVISLGQIAVPYIGVLLLVAAAKAGEMLGYRGQLIANAIPDASLYVIVAYWLSGRFFGGDGGTANPLAMDSDYLGKGRRLTREIGWVLALGAITVVIADIGGSQSTSILLLPIEILVAVFLFQFGVLIKRHCSGDNTEANSRNRVYAFIGQAAVLIAIVGPVLGIAGYGIASQSLLYPAVTTLAVLGLVLLLQRLVVDLYILFTGAPDSAGDALIPVLIGFVLLLIAVPVLALVWGAREADLLELWTRFREGFQIGDTRISPTDFITFAFVFGAGYAITRFVQGTLRATVLPKTRMDIGGQNAVVSGLGYLGIFLAAVIAITTAGIDLSNLAIVAGALSVGIGFGLQTIVQNFVSGIILLIERPISEGDWIEVNSQMGVVRDISVRATRIETFDRRDVIIPNADLVSGQVTNWTRGNLVGRIIVNVGVAYGTDTHRVEEILTEIAEAHPMVLLSQPPAVLFTGFGADSLDFEIRALLRDVNFMHLTKSEIHHEIAKRFAAEGIEIPFAQRDLWIRNPESLRPIEE
ncbi:hypothetical protein BVC71_05590 [Marivivens niveibacter]|uniref:Uncharacterized protein n=1 Tax=Marivivens niveibacter TaxID=1930667 RepID=A0A251X3I7_9RHOB|nr:DUF3772 domain-containing protein [Marivivens niveibacter]OUD10938.1 hypothetical protein BVC71_05590 [Marivivens niveibacter]